MKTVHFKPIGIIHSPFKNPADVPCPADISSAFVEKSEP